MPTICWEAWLFKMWSSVEIIWKHVRKAGSEVPSHTYAVILTSSQVICTYLQAVLRLSNKPDWQLGETVHLDSTSNQLWDQKPIWSGFWGPHHIGWRQDCTCSFPARSRTPGAWIEVSLRPLWGERGWGARALLGVAGASAFLPLFSCSGFGFFNPNWKFGLNNGNWHIPCY